MTVYLSVCKQDYTKSSGQIFSEKCKGGSLTNLGPVEFGESPGSQSGYKKKRKKKKKKRSGFCYLLIIEPFF